MENSISTTKAIEIRNIVVYVTKVKAKLFPFLCHLFALLLSAEITFQFTSKPNVIIRLNVAIGSHQIGLDQFEGAKKTKKQEMVKFSVLMNG